MMYDELIEELRYLDEYSKQINPTPSGIFREAADAIEELLAEREENYADSWKMAFEVERDAHRWIPVTERSPKKNRSYLVYVYGEVTEMNYWHGKWHSLGDDYTKAVTHWMPLPEPPKEET